MNSVFNKLKSAIMRGGKKKSMLISVVILVEIILLLVVATYAWVETVSSIKITNAGNDGTVDTYVFTEAMIGEGKGTIDIGKYFKQSGDMHLAPVSSADGENFYFPKAQTTNVYRKGNSSDKNTAYLSVSFKVRADTNADFFFTTNPDISVSDDIRVSVTAYTEGTSPGDLYDSTTGAPKYTKIYSNNASTENVVNSTTGAKGATAVEKFADHTKGKSSTYRLFDVGANETKIVTVNVWLQKKPNSNTDLTDNMSQAITINNLGITSSLTPRHVTLIPTPTWDTSGTTEYFYAWCWGATNGDASRLYKLELDDNEHYGFDYNGTYQNTLFLRSGNDNLTKDYLEGGHWNDNTVWNVTEDTSIPNSPVDPTYIIETINGSTQTDTSSGTSSTNKKSTGSWHDPATIKLGYVTDQSSTWGTLSATTYIGTTTSSHVIEQTNSSSQKHTDTVHAWPGKLIQLKATAKTNYAFVGWYLDADGTTPASGTYTNATYTANAPSTASEITYYAKFKETRKLTIYKYLDGNSSTTACGTITIGGNTSGTTVSSYSQTVDKGASVAFSATASTGYALQGIYTTATGSTTATSPVTLNSNTTYYARFTTNSYNVTARAYYSTNGGSSYTAGNTGGTVKAGSSAAGATSTASVKYKSSVTLVATPASGYEFVGWFSSTSSTSALSTSTSYSYTLNTAAATSVYARFKNIPWQLKGSFDGWAGTDMVKESDNVYSVTVDLAEGDNTYKIYNTANSGDSAWYGAANANDYKYGFGSNGTNTSFSALSNYSLNNNPGQDAHFVTHAGKYKFSFNTSNNQISISFVSYNSITITFDYSSFTNAGTSNAKIWYYCSGRGDTEMSNGGTNKKTLSITSSEGASSGFNRKNPTTNEFWNNWDAGNRGYSTTYKATGWGSGSWQ